jgi:outer membrane protein TolC
MKTWALLFILLVVVGVNPSYGQSHLPLNQYLEQVKQNNLGLQGSRKISYGASQREGEGRQITKPSLFAQGEYLKSVNNPLAGIAGTDSQQQSYKLGLSQTTSFGLQGRIYYDYQHQSFSGINPTLINNSQTTNTASPVIELTLPLARNWAGRETRATVALLESEARMTKYSERFKARMILANAEVAYWRLAIASQMVAIQQQSLQRAEKIRTWTTKQSTLLFAGTSDLLQAEAAVESRKLDLATALDQQRLSARVFNTFRGVSGFCVTERLESIDNYSIDRLKIPERMGPRDDVKAAAEQTKIARANAQLGIEKNKPNLELYTIHAFNGIDPSANEAISQSFSWNYPSTVVGLRFQMPLDRKLSGIRSGYKNEICGAEDQFRQQAYEDRRLWEELLLRLERAKNRLGIAQQLKSIQLKKVKEERARLALGKTTTYQVLMFEQDYANAQLSALLVQSEILELLAQLKTYGA